MTCIVGLLDSGKVYIGADSSSTAGWGRRLVGDLKVFQNGPFLVGLAGEPRVAQLLKHSLSPPRPAEGSLVTETDVERFLCIDLVDAIRKCLKDGGVAQKDNDREKFDSQFLVGFRGRLVTITGQYYVAPTVDGFAAVGCGEDYAMGVLHATEGQPPEQRLTTALEAAARFSAGVAPPFFIKESR